MSKIKIVRDSSELSIFFEGELWKKISRTVFFNSLSDLYRATSIEEAEEIFFTLERKAAKALAIRCLGRRSWFSLELRQKMQDKGLSSEAISEALLFCEKMGALDDVSLAKIRTERELRRGKGQVAALIKIKRWVDVEAVSLDLCKIKELEKEALLQYIQKKRIDVEVLSFNEKGKLYLVLMRRGFKRENIQDVLGF